MAGREIHRRLVLLGMLGAVAAVWTVAVRGPSVVADVANAAPSPARAQPQAAACPFPARLRDIFEDAAVDANLPPALLYAVAKVESNLRENARSNAGATGLLQVMPETARALNLDAAEPRTNVLAGARYLRQLLDRFNSIDLAFAAYNAGPTAVEAAGGAPTAGVYRYVANVNTVWRSVAGCR